MAKRIDLTGQYINEWFVEKYLGNKLYHCVCSCGKEDNVHADSLRKGYRKSCGHLEEVERQSFIGKQFDDWTPMRYIGKGKYFCECSCGNKQVVSKYDLENKKSKSCGHDRIKDLAGKKFGEWLVIRYVGGKKWLCQCSCGKFRNVFGHTLTNGESKSCGHRNGNNGEFQDISGMTFGDWTVIDYAGNSKWNCICSCGEHRSVASIELRSGRSKSCGHDTNQLKNMSGQRFGKLLVKDYLGCGFWYCNCDCGNNTIKLGKSLRNGRSKHCGCETLKALQNNSKLSRNDAQKNAVISRENFRRFVGSDKPTLLELSKKLGVTYASTVRLCHNYESTDLVTLFPNISYKEQALYDYISELVGERYTVIQSDREVLRGKELDIYIPELKLAIEFNGNYWHSSLFKDKYYHQQKTIACAKQGIQLIHIFEHEWDNEKLNRILRAFLKKKIIGCSSLNLDDVQVFEVDIQEASTFCYINSLHEYKISDINITLKEGDTVQALLSLNEKGDGIYEVSNLCLSLYCTINNWVNLLMEYFIETYTPNHIVLNIDISKFSGNRLIDAGFKVRDIKFNDPKHIWCNISNGSIIEGIYTQIDKLINMGLCTLDSSEDQIMEDMDFIKIYDCGSLRLEWNKKD